MVNSEHITKNPRYYPLGKLLSDAREAKGWSRSEVAQKAGVNGNTLAKFEKAGTDAEDARWPNANDLAKLCNLLDIDPGQALLGSFNRDEFEAGAERSTFNQRYINHPKFAWMTDQVRKAYSDATLLRSFIRLLFPYISADKLPEELNWLYEEGCDVVDRLSDFETRMLQLGVFSYRIETLYLPSHHWDAVGENWIFDIVHKGVISEEILDRFPKNIVAKSLKDLAKDFTRLSAEVDSLENPEEWQAAIIIEVEKYKKNDQKEAIKNRFKEYKAYRDIKRPPELRNSKRMPVVMDLDTFYSWPYEKQEESPEEDLPSPPSSSPNNPPLKQENDDGQSSE